VNSENDIYEVFSQYWPFKNVCMSGMLVKAFHVTRRNTDIYRCIFRFRYKSTNVYSQIPVSHSFASRQQSASQFIITQPESWWEGLQFLTHASICRARCVLSLARPSVTQVDQSKTI